LLSSQFLPVAGELKYSALSTSISEDYFFNLQVLLKFQSSVKSI